MKFNNSQMSKNKANNPIDGILKRRHNFGVGFFILRRLMIPHGLKGF